MTGGRLAQSMTASALPCAKTVQQLQSLLFEMQMKEQTTCIYARARMHKGGP